jgi:ferritin-like metal-binding protein YciE
MLANTHMSTNTNNSSELTSKVVEHLNEMLSAENAAIDRIESRIDQTPMESAKQRLKQHLEETRGHQDRLQQLISRLGGQPTDSKADLPILKPPSTSMIKKTVKDTVKSMTGGSDNPMPEEMELMRTKQDLIIENAEIVAYDMLIQICQRSSLDDAIPTLKQNLSEEESMANWIKTNTPTMLDQLWPKIVTAVSSR